MYTQRLNFSYFACIYLLFRLVTKSSVNPIWRHLCLIGERPFNLKGGGGYAFFLKKYSDSQCC